jgi:hypothetical protein
MQNAKCKTRPDAKRFCILHFAFCISLLAACAKPEPPPQPKKAALPPPPTTAAAQELIANAPDFSDYQFTNAAFTFAQRKSLMTPLMAGGVKQLAAAKWIRIDGDDIVLTDKAKGDKRFLVRPNGYVDVVPLAKKEMIGVTAVHQQPDGLVLADFAWKWVPNEIGAAISQPATGDRKATAKLMWDGSAWTVLGITSSS